MGSNRSIPVDIRVIAASNRDPQQAIQDQKLREDLYYRLNVFNIALPPLRERQQDILCLATHFLGKHAAEFGYPFNGIAPIAEEYLMTYHWPGNVRELENMMERAIVFSGGKTITLDHLPQDLGINPYPVTTNPELIQNNTEVTQFEIPNLTEQVELLERHLIEQALTQAGDNKAKAAQLLQISERSLWYKLKKYGLTLN